jgi:hypothetical protein
MAIGNTRDLLDKFLMGFRECIEEVGQVVRVSAVEE